MLHNQTEHRGRVSQVQDQSGIVGNIIKVPFVHQDVHSYTGVTPATKNTPITYVHSGPLRQVPVEFFPVRRMVTTPVNVDLLEKYLIGHPKRELVDFIISGFNHGFRLGVQDQVMASVSKNNQSAHRYEDKVDEAILKELNRGHTVGPFDSFPFPNFHCSPLGAAPKKDGTVRVVLDLSSPKGLSVNDGIDREDYSVSYSSFDEAVEVVRRLGRCCYLAKLDVKHAFRLCPVYCDDWPLLGYKWKGRYYFDVVLPFGGRSSPFIFNNFADVLAWIFLNHISIEDLLHYLDDFLTANKFFHVCQEYVTAICNLCKILGVPLAPEKIIGPAQIITYLGIEIDTIEFIIRLPEEKLRELMDTLQVWKDKKKCKKRELQSLIGSLSFACKVVKCGRMFLRRLIDLSTTVTGKNHYIDITAEGRKDIWWWLEFLPTWNGVEVIQSRPILSVDIRLFTDASDVGLGGFYNGQWFSISLEGKVKHSIGYFELLSIVVAVLCWGSNWRDSQVVLFTDHEALVHIWKTGSCKCPFMMALIRKLFFFTAEHNINLLLQHVNGTDNVYADLLSRLQVAQFLALCQDAAKEQTFIPDFIWEILHDA